MVGYRLTATRNQARCVGLILALVLLAACDGDSGDQANPTTTRRSSPVTVEGTSTTAIGEDGEVRAGYEAASEAFIEAAAVPDPDFPGLAETHVDPMLQQRRETLLALKADGRAIRYPTPSEYRIEVDQIMLDGEVARLVACVVDDGERVDASTGDVIASGVGTVEWRVAMRRVDGQWRLAERVENARWEGVDGCAAA